MNYILLHEYILLKIIIVTSMFYMCSTQKLPCSNIDDFRKLDPIVLSKSAIPELDGKIKGDNGKIGVIGGSTEYTGAPYFSAITALKVGADLVYVITTENAAPVIKSYSPELIVYPYFNANSLSKVKLLLAKMDVIVIGPGLGRENHTLQLIYEVINASRELHKPLVIDADGLYAVSNCLSILDSYPSPGAILTPNYRELQHFKKKMFNGTYNNWGHYVPILIKGKEDKFLPVDTVPYGWMISEGGSGRRAGGQGDILAGALATFYNWALKANLCENGTSVKLAQSIAAYAAAKITRNCNSNAFAIHGRSMTASDMLNEIHAAFDDLFLK